MSLKKAMVVFGIIFLVSLGLCGLSASGNGSSDAIAILSLIGMLVSGLALAVVFVIWMVREIYHALRERND